MSEETATTIIEQPAFDDPVAARGEAILRMCLAARQIEEDDARATLLRAAERIIASIPIAPGGQASVLSGPATKNRL